MGRVTQPLQTIREGLKDQLRLELELLSPNGIRDFEFQHPGARRRMETEKSSLFEESGASRFFPGSDQKERFEALKPPIHL